MREIGHNGQIIRERQGLEDKVQIMIVLAPTTMISRCQHSEEGIRPIKRRIMAAAILCQFPADRHLRLSWVPEEERRRTTEAKGEEDLHFVGPPVGVSLRCEGRDAKGEGVTRLTIPSMIGANLPRKRRTVCQSGRKGLWNPLTINDASPRGVDRHLDPSSVPGGQQLKIMAEPRAEGAAMAPDWSRPTLPRLAALTASRHPLPRLAAMTVLPPLLCWEKNFQPYRPVEPRSVAICTTLPIIGEGRPFRMIIIKRFQRMITSTVVLRAVAQETEVGQKVEAGRSTTTKMLAEIPITTVTTTATTKTLCLC